MTETTVKTTKTWSVRELEALRRHYPDMNVLAKKLPGKTSYLIDKKAKQLGLMNSKHTSQDTEERKPIGRPVSRQESVCKLYDPKHPSIEELEIKIAYVEQRIARGIDDNREWDLTINRYNDLCLQYNRALDRNNQKNSSK